MLTYRYRVHGGDWESVRQVVTLDWTPCHYGGTRPWFLSPGCHRRATMLCGEGKWFLCRYCYELPYGSQQETADDRHYRKVRKIRDRLGISHNLTEPVWPWNKPKGMHWRTCQLAWDHQAVEAGGVQLLDQGFRQALLALDLLMIAADHRPQGGRGLHWGLRVDIDR